MKRLSAFFILGFLAMFYSCQRNAYSSGKLRVTATTNLVADIVKEIGGDEVELEVLMGPGVDPHLYKPTHSDLTKLADADLILYNGLHLEGKMQEIFEKISEDRVTVPLAASIPADKIMYPGGGEAPDPHVWFDPQLWKYCVQAAADALSEMDTAHAALFQERARIYIEELETLDAQIREEIQTIPLSKRVLITSHDAFGYYGRAYNLKVRGVQGISTTADAGLKDMQNLLDEIRHDGVKAVFVETSVNSDYVEALLDRAAASNYELREGGTLYSDALGEEDGPEGNYIGMLRYNTQKITEGLR